MVDIYGAVEGRDKYPPLSPILRGIIVLVYTTQADPKFGLYLTIRQHIAVCQKGTKQQDYCLYDKIVIYTSRFTYSHIHIYIPVYSSPLIKFSPIFIGLN